MARQMLKYINDNEIIYHSHHSGLWDKSTQTLITELHDGLAYSMSTGEESALIILDQSKAFNIIRHNILLEKLKIISFNEQTMKLMKLFLKTESNMCKLIVKTLKLY